MAMFSFTKVENWRTVNRRNKHNLHLSSVHSEYGKRSIKFKASNLWNKLPENLKNITSLHAFKKSLKIFLLNADI